MRVRKNEKDLGREVRKKKEFYVNTEMGFSYGTSESPTYSLFPPPLKLPPFIPPISLFLANFLNIWCILPSLLLSLSSPFTQFHLKMRRRKRLTYLQHNNVNNFFFQTATAAITGEKCIMSSFVEM